MLILFIAFLILDMAGKKQKKQVLPESSSEEEQESLDPMDMDMMEEGEEEGEDFDEQLVGDMMDEEEGEEALSELNEGEEDELTQRLQAMKAKQEAGLDEDEEEGEMDMDEEEGEAELVDDGALVSDEGEAGEGLDEFPDEDALQSNIERKRDKAISDLLKKEDLGLI